ncbi:hypothetical protein Glove_54g163 [Diversispora epigaea]|uniref:Uncharacterized protein n=1 Tax=Diversispora epigaea TaxID=1348612 RepID=A0A397JLS3_9GLOM|nr:hypothetical protein Glove_54g163 [Diversispora epigaea]
MTFIRGESMCEKYAGHDKYDHADQSRSRFCGRTTFLPSIVHTLRDFITPFLIAARPVVALKPGTDSFSWLMQLIL